MFRMLGNVVDGGFSDFGGVEVTDVDVYESFGIEPCLDWDTLAEWYEVGEFSSVGRFNQLVDYTYISNSNWGILTTNNVIGKALYARALYHLYRLYEHSVLSGEGTRVDNVDLVIPKYIDEGKLYSYGVNRYTMYAFLPVSDSSSELYLSDYKEQLEHVDNKFKGSYEKYLGHGNLRKYLKGKLHMVYLENGIRLRLRDGYVLSKDLGIEGLSYCRAVSGRSLTGDIERGISEAYKIDGIGIRGFEVTGYILNGRDRLTQVVDVDVEMGVDEFLSRTSVGHDKIEVRKFVG